MQYNSERGGGATIEALAMSLQVAAKGMDAENDVLFLILTSHGSPAGLAIKAGRFTEHLEPSSPRMAGGANVQPLLIARP